MEPHELLITSVPFCHAQLMPSALLSLDSGLPAKELLTDINLQLGAMPETPAELFLIAPIIPAQAVP